jgi:hypothetical protein
MKSDVQEYFKTSKPSFLDLVSQETKLPPADFGYKKKINPFPFIIGTVVLAIAGTLAFFFLLPFRETPEVKKIITPAPFFATESSRTISVETKDRNSFLQLMADSYREQDRTGTIKRIIIKLEDNTGERFADFADFTGLYRMSPPALLVARPNSPLMTYFFAGSDGNRFGLAAKVKDPDRTFLDMLSWESSIFLDTRPLLFDQPPESTLALVEDRTYRNIDWRYQKLSPEKDFGIGYAVFPAKNLLIIVTSKELMEAVINRLFDAR